MKDERGREDNEYLGYTNPLNKLKILIYNYHDILHPVEVIYASNVGIADYSGTSVKYFDEFDKLKEIALEPKYPNKDHFYSVWDR